MTTNRKCDMRQGASLIEVLVVVSILVVLFGLIVAGIQRVREVVARTQSMNNLRQLALGMHSVAATFDGFAGGYTKPDPKSHEEYSLIVNRPHLFGNPQHLIVAHLSGKPMLTELPYSVEMYLISPGDPSDRSSYRLTRNTCGPTSYSFNMVAFTGPPRVTGDIRDGTSTTIAFSERYFERYFSPSPIDEAVDHYAKSWMAYGEVNPALPSALPPFPLNDHGVRRPSFADAGWADVVPVTSGSPPTSRPSIPGVTFQVKPRLIDANAYQIQTPFSSGLPVSMFDGSVRVISRGVDSSLFWSLVTAVGAESISSDW